MDKGNNEQNKSAQKIRDFKRNIKPRNPNMIKERLDAINNALTVPKGRGMVYNFFENGIFQLLNQSIMLAKPEKSSSLEHSRYYYECNLPETEKLRRGLKLLTPKQMLQILPIALAQVKAD